MYYRVQAIPIEVLPQVPRQNFRPATFLNLPLAPRDPGPNFVPAQTLTELDRANR